MKQALCRAVDVQNSIIFSMLIILSWTSTACAQPVWLQPFAPRNNVTWDAASGLVTMQGAGDMGPSAGLLSVDSYAGDVAINATIAAWGLYQ